MKYEGELNVTVGSYSTNIWMLFTGLEKELASKTVIRREISLRTHAIDVCRAVIYNIQSEIRRLKIVEKQQKQVSQKRKK